MKNTSLFIYALFMLFFSSMVISAQKYTHQKLTDNVYIMTRHWEGVSISYGVVVGQDGLLLVNCNIASDAHPFEEALRKISDLPVKYVLNNNYDGGNAHLNGYFAHKGAQIISHQALKYSTIFTQNLVDDGYSMEFGGQTISMHHSGGHSFGHMNIRLKQANILFMADSYRSDWLTVFGPKGVDGHIGGLESALTMIDEQTVIVPGNVLPDQLFASRADVMQQIKSTGLFKSLVQKLSAKGLSPEEITEHQEIKSFFKTYYPERLDFDIISRVRNAVNFHVTPDYKATSKELDELLGKYVSNNGKIFEVIVQDGRLIARSEGNYILPLKWTDKNTVINPSGELNEQFEIVRNELGQIRKLKLHFGKSWQRRYVGTTSWSKL
ncbi:hypothetical protein L1077_04810 [Pseudoalteromonas luteoviolacea]|uniref:hypothetical protein n=1 Tax=Pseudoalteromonas luteoviolacea TaxID=43657 RepID=UPI001F1BAF60|nr:hypothetical protein [Pseudoalteromonas luteoviolacea]MCF6438750.1 hypothetical protein [Pseudoalteromonas luteoviolacea]